jgi:hypothetical protein
MSRILTALLALALCAGCMKPLDEQVKKDPNSKFGKTTQEVGEFKPGAGAQVVQPAVNATDPISAPVGVLVYALERTDQLNIEHALDLFNASEGRYPNSHEEFMTRIIKENGYKLHVLPGNKKYQYDVANHQLLVVDAPAEGGAANSPQ